MAAEAGVDLEQETALGFQAGVDRRCLLRAADEKRRRGEKREGKGDLRDDERIAREKFPVPPNDIFAGVFFQVTDD